MDKILLSFVVCFNVDFLVFQSDTAVFQELLKH